MVSENEKKYQVHKYFRELLIFSNYCLLPILVLDRITGGGS